MKSFMEQLNGEDIRAFINDYLPGFFETKPGDQQILEATLNTVFWDTLIRAYLDKHPEEAQLLIEKIKG